MNISPFAPLLILLSLLQDPCESCPALQADIRREVDYLHRLGSTLYYLKSHSYRLRRETPKTLQVDFSPFLGYFIHMEYKVIVPKRVQKDVDRLPAKERRVYERLVLDIKKSGPVQPSYKNYSKLGKDRYHCHLSYHWIACWWMEDGTVKVEVYYVGSRESAPY